MIKSFKHKGLQQFFESGSAKGIQSKHKTKLVMRLSALDTAFTIDDLDLPSFNLHQLKGQREETWSIKVNGNWRVTFLFQDGDVYVVNYEDYH